MIGLLLSFALAACEPSFGIQDMNGSWRFSNKQEPGMVKIDACHGSYAHTDLIFKGGKYLVDKEKQEARILAEATEEALLKAKGERLKSLAEKSRKGSLSDEEAMEATKLILESVK